MRHEKTKKMQDYWMQLWLESGMNKDHYGRLLWPERSSVQPMHCPELLGDMFILDIANGANTFRLAGTRLCAMMGRELKGKDFDGLFVDEDQRAAESWATGLAEDDYLVLICSDGFSRDGRAVPLETLLMPLNQNGERGQRALGLTVPLDMPAWMLSQGIVEKAIRSVRILRPWELEPQNEFDKFAQTGGRPSISVSAPTLYVEPDEQSNDQGPLVAEDGKVRGAPHLRVLKGGGA